MMETSMLTHYGFLKRPIHNGDTLSHTHTHTHTHENTSTRAPLRNTLAPDAWTRWGDENNNNTTTQTTQGRMSARRNEMDAGTNVYDRWQSAEQSSVPFSLSLSPTLSLSSLSLSLSLFLS